MKGCKYFRSKNSYQAYLDALIPCILIFCTVLLSTDALARSVSNKIGTERERIVVGVPTLFPPQYQLTQNGQPGGFAVEMFEAVADEAGLLTEYKVYPDWKATFEALKTHEIDVIPNIGISEKRKNNFDYTQPIETFGVSIFVRDSETDINFIRDLNDKVVVTVLGNVSVGLLMQEPQINVQVKDDVETALFALLSGDADAMVYPEPWTNQMAIRIGVEDRIKKVGQPLLEVKRAMAVRKGDILLLRQLNVVLDRYVGSKAYQALYVKWFGKNKHYWTTKRVILTILVVTMITILLLIFLHYLSVVKINQALRRSELALQNSEEQLKLALDGSNDGLWDWDIKTNNVFYSSRWCEILGYKSVDIVPVYESWAELVHPREAEYLQIRIQALLEGQSEIVNIEHRLKHKNGSWVWVLARGKVVSKNSLGEPNRIVGTLMDITERMEAEKLLSEQEIEHREVIDNMIDAVMTIDEKGIVHSFNTAAESMFGYRREEFIGRNVKEIMPSIETNLHAGDIQRYRQIRETEVISSGRDIQGRHKDTSVFPLRLSLTELPRGECEQRRFIGACFDITEQKEQEELLRRSQKMDALGKLTSGIAHDYNNMLNVIIGYAGILKKKLKSDPDLSSLADEIEHAGERGAELTKKLLLFSSTQPARAKSTDINALLAESYNMLAKTLTVKIELTQQLGEDLWLVMLDKGDLEDAVLNMSINAMQAMVDGGKLEMETKNITLTPEKAKQVGIKSGDYVKLSITDTGTGMDEETRLRVFDPFFSTKGNMGTGLGLSQVYGFVRRSGGGIEVLSKPGSGTKINLYFPRKMQQDEVETKTAIVEPIVELHGHESVLVVDDEEGIRRLTKDILSNEGYKVLLAENADAALAILKQQHIDVLFTDVLMPGIDGYELANIVKREYPEIKILLASGYTGEKSNRVIDEVLHANMLNKPFAPQQVLQRLRGLLDAVD